MMEMAMTTAVRQKFSSQAAPDVLAALRQIAESQGRQFQAVLDDALRDYIDRQQKERPRRHVMASFASSLEEFDSLYRELAKSPSTAAGSTPVALPCFSSTAPPNTRAYRQEMLLPRCQKLVYHFSVREVPHEHTARNHLATSSL